MSTPLSRRTFIAASAAAVATPLTRTHGDAMSFAVRSRSGLRLERHGDSQRPSVALFLPKRSAPSLVIEMPEHAWYREKPSGQQTWFYKMYGSAPAFQGSVEWSVDSNALAYVMQTPSGFTLSSRATLEEDGVAITHKIVSSSRHQIAALEAPTCVKLYRPFLDIFLERTYVHLPDGLALIASETPDRLTKNAEEWLPCRYIACVGRNAPRKPYRTEILDGVRRYFKSDAADTAFIATESSSGGWTVATYTPNASDCDSVFTNPARTCHHADPRAKSITDGQATLALKALVIKGSANDAWKLVKSMSQVT